MDFQGFIFFDETWSIKKKWNVVFPAKKPQNGCFAENQDIRIITLVGVMDTPVWPSWCTTTHGNTVRPLLTFYGVASLARSTLLLLKRVSGEESLTRGHGLETVGWSNTLSGDLPSALKSLGTLKVRTSAGLYSDFLKETGNRVCMHVRSSAVDWRLTYNQPPLGEEKPSIVLSKPRLTKRLHWMK